ncbi:MAG TPA: serine/threonine-protein kinase [Candidatus Krumholzibacteria bacterium]|nr:serine/threonine-protein kinase [Candidatus Krumholzibacteria bacterium]HPD70195.1 serine/threonine-protein kinase [Candidatus Krumholzibacteria bacterium]HRY40105.1 serine/threonine-protein kinase [Candidatus Krumholzibacteria bacterium]
MVPPQDESPIADESESRTRPIEGAPQPQSLIGDYRIVRKLGEGGMGVVYEAEQQHPRRAVALKVIRGGQFVDDTRLRMFQREAQALARLKHPGIAAIYGSGATADGQHFFAMELVRGETLAHHLDRQRGPRLSPAAIRDRIALFLRICDAVNYAHQRGVIHRDLKPSNVLVLPPASETPSGQVSPRIKILDFGLARITDADLATITVATEVGQVQGTLPYMSPEQIAGNSDQIDLRTDVYSLGVVLYEMLTHALPFEVRGKPLHEAARIINEDTPRPLRKVWTGARRPDADLETIILKATEKEPARRYQSVSALAEDLDRYLHDQPIHARPASAVYQLRKMIARHRAEFGLATAVLVLLVAFAVGMTVQAGRIARERDRANEQAEAARQVSTFLADVFKVPDPGESRGNSVTAREVLDRGAERIRQELTDQPAVRARLMRTMAEVYSNLGLYAEAKALAQEAWGIERELHPEDHVDTAESLLLTGSIVGRAGDDKEAERLMREALAMMRRIEEQPRLQTASCLQNLAIVLKRMGQLPEAEAAYREALDLRRQGFGPRHETTASTMTSLAELLRLAGNLEEAAALNREALAIFSERYGEVHPDISACLNNLALVLQAQGEYGEAETLLRRALALDTRLFGEESRYTAGHLRNLGALLQECGRLDEAEAAQRRALAINQRVLGPDHPDVAANLNNLAVLRRDQGDLAEAERFIREALALVGRTSGKEHWHYGASLYNLAKIQHLRHDYRGAESTLRDAATVLAKAYPPTHPRLADIRSFLGDCLARQGRVAEAETLLVGAYESLRTNEGADDRIMRKARDRLIEFYESTGRATEAAKYR